jgi:hypothetical protein
VRPNPELIQSVPDRVRSACAWVAGRAREVRIEESAIEAYVEGLAEATSPVLDPETHYVEGDRESRAAFVLCLDAINFGSGWWPTIEKQPGRSGYFTIAAGLTARFRDHGAWSAQELKQLSSAELAEVLGQASDHPLMDLHAASLHDVGVHLLGEHDGRFTAPIDAAGGSAVALADRLAAWQAFADVSTYDGRPVPFFKRAQIAPADLDRAGVATFRDVGRLTAFADNLVPHVLHLDGILRLDPALAEAIDSGELLRHGSPAEVELRACAVHAVELLSDATGRSLPPVAIDAALWSRGGEPRYKERPRPRSRNTAY